MDLSVNRVVRSCEMHRSDFAAGERTCAEMYVPFRLLLCFGFVTAPSCTGLLVDLGGGAILGFGIDDFLGGTTGAGVRMGDFLRKTDGEGIWTSMRCVERPTSTPVETTSSATWSRRCWSRLGWWGSRSAFAWEGGGSGDEMIWQNTDWFPRRDLEREDLTK